MSYVGSLKLSLFRFFSVIFGRAIKNEHLALGTMFSTAAIAFASMSGGKKEAAAPKGQSLVEKVKEAVPINAGSRCVLSGRSQRGGSS